MGMDINYLAGKICDMSGVPIRLYCGGALVSLHSIVPLPYDPFTLYKDEVFGTEQPLGYIMTEQADYYCFLRLKEDGMLVIGPSRLNDYTVQELRALALALKVPAEDYEAFQQSVRAIVHMPLDSLLQVISTMHYAINGEKTELEDIKIIPSAQETLTDTLNHGQAEARFFSGETIELSDRYKAYQIERLLCEYVRRGDTAGFLKWCETAPSLRTSVLSKDYLRHLKNTFIVSATLFSRAAIRGGMDVEAATALFDNYVQKCEQLSLPRAITELQYHMVRTLTEQVGKIRLEKIDTELQRKVYSYIQKNISAPIRTEDIAAALYMSRSHLSTVFKKTTGMKLNDYVHKVKIAEAKHLLRYSDKSMPVISNYLGYSSQSYFCNVFKKFTGLTPKEYQNQS